MPTTDAPKRQPPMGMDAGNLNPAQAAVPTPGANAVVTRQPTSEPRPTMDGDMALRGGGLNHYCGFSCCKGRCNFRLC